MKKMRVFTLLFSFFFIQGLAYSEEVGKLSDQCMPCIQETLPSCNFENCLKASRLELGAAVGDYIGIRRGYTEIGYFGMIKVPAETYVFLDARGFLISNHDWVTSLGLGFRKPLDPCSPVIFGANIYYDYRNVHFSKEKHCESCLTRPKRPSLESLGVGFEILTEGVDFRANVYLPVKDKLRSKAYYTYSNGYFASVKVTRDIPYGFDGEISKRLNFYSTLYATGAVGGYGYFYRQAKDIYGPFVRLELGWRDYLSLQARYSYDNHFHSSVQGKVMLSLPFEILTQCFDTCSVRCFDPIIQSVQRNYIPFTQKKCCWKWNW